MTEVIWEDKKEYLIGNFGNQVIAENDILAAYDLDHTIIVPKVGKLFPNKKPNEWSFLPGVIDKIKLDTENSKFLIVTNQKNLNKKQPELTIWKQKVSDVLKVIGIPCIVLVSFSDGRYRKPSPFIVLDNFKFKKENSFYCGDAGGIYMERSYTVNGTDINHEKDFADTDYKFAINLGIKFIHRDEYVYSDTSNELTITYPTLNINTENSTTINYVPLKLAQKEMVILVGAPGCGKSSLSKKYELLDYNIINQDTLKTFKKCIVKTTESIENNKSMVIDNTNPSKKVRQEYITLGKKSGYLIHCIYFDVSMDNCKHNNIYRSIVTPERAVVPTIAYNYFKKNLEIPATDEGLDIVTILTYSRDPLAQTEYNYYYF
jgi:bifunctional polynucleotide phosphatase/kinase